MKNKTQSVIQSSTNPNTARLSTEPSQYQYKCNIVAPNANSKYFYKSRLINNKMVTNQTRSTITQTIQIQEPNYQRRIQESNHLVYKDRLTINKQIEIKQQRLEYRRQQSYQQQNQMIDKYQIKKQNNSHNFKKQRIKEPQTFRHLIGQFQNQLKSVPKEIESLQDKCKNKQFLKRAATKYFIIQKEQVGQEIKNGKINIASILEDNLKQQIRKNKSSDMKEKIKSQVFENNKQFDDQIHYMKIQNKFEMDSMFQINSRQFNKFEQANALDRKFNTLDHQPQQNLYLNYYLDSQRKNCYYQQDPDFVEKYREETLPSYKSLSSVDEECIQEAIDNVNEQELQYHNYKNNIRNPFIENKELLQIMKKSGIVKSLIKKKKLL